MDDIKLETGVVIGQWDGRDVKQLLLILMRLGEKHGKNNIAYHALPHEENIPKDLRPYTDYPIWACDQRGNCLVGESGDTIESFDEIRD